MEAERVVCMTDSKLVEGQLTGQFQVKEPLLLQYYHLTKEILSKFQQAEVRHLPRNLNARADELAKLASNKKPGQHHSVIQLTLSGPSIATCEVMAMDTQAEDWRTPIMAYLKTQELPEDPITAKAVRMQAARHVLIAGELYKRGISSPLLKCITGEEAEYVLEELHKGVCGRHTGGRAMAARVLRAGYFWPTMRKDCIEYTKRCYECQKHGHLIHQPANELHGVFSPWPFAMWGMDLLGPFPIARGQCKYLLVAVDYFTKWIEAEPLAKITAHNVRKFIWQNIITRFGLPHAIITDNGQQFKEKNLEELLKAFRIHHRVTSVEHPQSNGQAEAANKNILEELKKKLDDSKGAWVDILADILWGYRCTPHSATGETPYRLTYGMDAMLPVEVGEPSPRRQFFRPEDNEPALGEELDMVEEVRENARVRAMATKQRASRRYNTNLKNREFKKGDLVWRMQTEARKESAEGKLAANWAGPFRVAEPLNNGSYKLEYLTGELIPRTWNATHLKLYYS